MNEANPNNIERGRDAEQRAQAFLINHKLNVVTSNYRTRFGEIDLVMREGDTLVFVEVRRRNSHTHGSAAESITHNKQAKIIRTAHTFLETHHHRGPVRFDVITFDGATLSTPTWIKNAFEAEW